MQATLKFIEEDIITTKVTVFVPDECYPAGAAGYFYKALMCPTKSNFATKFIKCVDNAEITESHKAHKDTLYKYNIYKPFKANIFESEIKVLKKEFDHIADQTIEVEYFSGKLYEFIESEWKLRKERLPDTDWFATCESDYKPFVYVPEFGYVNEIMAKYLPEKELLKEYFPNIEGE